MTGIRAGSAVALMLVAVTGACVPNVQPPASPPPAQSPVTPPAPPPVPARAASAPSLSGQMIQGGLITGQAAPGTAALSLDGRTVAVAPDGRFVFGFDRDATPSATLTVTGTDGSRMTVPLTVAPRAWDISRLSSLPKVPVPQPEFAARRPAELARIVAARALTTDAAGWRQRFSWPVTGRISTLFGSQRIYANGEAGSYHSGIDIARPTGTLVTAPADGVVILAADAPFTLEGNLLMIDHGMGLNSAFLHLSRIDVAVGDRVRQGQPIGLVGATGRATGPHLHWSLQWQGAKLDPLLAAGPMR
ncbi:Murein DD-endopeptidase MepM and murein hydrolase activator NlpD, contain LysM domain [Sphingomonas gellani]|uniref:Murein DD-endopeptidase MepM and murein hydrolase activator NlpD, contain LysM domain n=1 Tax=Sphingomonas gellani TaxID=1166340 RepID=A0A1H8IZH6_9SPHN|nr:M23 family metallopeptidase [Sphingomonas gellani]SEN73545.1 Murein DD-endopeptidase MepM and murein hydrolase activator NlpD, contain LysM domain [Sphingomonas gellani]